MARHCMYIQNFVNNFLPNPHTDLLSYVPSTLLNKFAFN